MANVSNVTAGVFVHMRAPDLTMSQLGDNGGILAGVVFFFWIAFFVLIPFARWAHVFSTAPAGKKAGVEDGRGWLSQITWWWFSDVVNAARRAPLHSSSLPDLPYADTQDSVSARMLAARASLPPDASFSRIFFRASRKTLVVTGVYRLMYEALQFAPPLLLEQLIAHLAGYGPPGWRWGALLCAAIYALSLVSSWANAIQFYGTLRVGVMFRTATTQALHDKILRLTPASKASPDAAPARLASILTGDVQRIYEFMFMVHGIWASPLSIIVSVSLLAHYLGWPAAVAVGAIVVVFPIQGLIMKKLVQVRREQSTRTDERVKLTTDLFGGIKVVKMMSWVSAFLSRILAVRDNELEHIKQRQSLSALIFSLLTLTPQLTTFLTFLAYGGNGQFMSPVVVFPAMSLLGVLRMPLMLLPRLLASFTDIRISFARVDAVMALEEAAPFETLPVSATEPYGIEITGRPTFAWAPPVTTSALAAAPNPSGGQPSSSPSRGHPNRDVVVVPGGRDMAVVDVEAAAASPKSPTVRPDGLRVVLRDVELRLPRGGLTMVVGRTGAGKSTLLSTILGETIQVPGSAAEGGGVVVRGSVAYVAQEAWVLNQSLRDNVLFFTPFDPARYKAAVEACCLAADLAQLPAGDSTEIGEKGINLSGGQKQRVALARAVYANRDVYLLDDPLAAVDAHVGAALFERCVSGALAGKTRVLVTHHTHWADRADCIVVVDGGTVAFCGTPAALRAHPTLAGEVFHEHHHGHGDHAAAGAPSRARGSAKLATRVLGVAPAGGLVPALLTPGAADEWPAAAAPIIEAGEAVAEECDTDHCEEETARAAGKPAKSPQPPHSPPAPPAEGGAEGGKGDEVIGGSGADGTLVQAEAQGVGGVSLAVWWRYLKAAGGVPAMLAFLVVFVLTSCAMLSTDFWLSYWTAGSLARFDLHTVIIPVYAGLCVAFGVVTFVRSFFLYAVLRRAARTLHVGMLNRVSGATAAFFDTTPAGRVLNRFTKDVDALDNSVPETFSLTVLLLNSLLSAIGSVAASQPYVTAFVVVFVLVYGMVLGRYQPANRDLKRLEAITRSPILSLMQETVGGLPSIRAYGLVGAFRAEMERRNNQATAPMLMTLTGSRWVSLRVESIGTLITLATAVSAVATTAVDPLNSQITGVGLVSSFSISMLMNVFVRQFADTEAQMSSAERVVEYTTDIPLEPTAARVGAPPVAAQWPETGEVRMEAVSARYREGLPLVLSEVSFSAPAGTKVGVVGRTGSGKSTLLGVLFRLIPTASGAIRLAGQDINDLEMDRARRPFTVLPQDPLMFVGSVRYNLDPLREATDTQIWAALSRLGLDERIRSDPLGLNAPVADGGANFSVGERQLLCLARALLRPQTRVLLLDEATASVDRRTDQLVQQVVRSEFRATTVLTIAHRLATVADYDAVLVMDHGKVAEYGSPQALLARPGGVFRSMVESSGPAGAAEVAAIVARNAAAAAAAAGVGPMRVV